MGTGRRARSDAPYRFACFAVAVVLTVVLAGCGSGEAPKDAANEKGEPTTVLDAEKGLHLSAETRQAMGIQTATATARTIHPELQATAQVFACTTNSAGNFRVQASALFPINTNYVKVGTTATLLPPPFTGPGITGKIVRVDDEVRAAYGQTEVVIEAPDSDRRFSEGSFVQAQVATGSQSAKVAVPQLAVVHAALGDFVYLAKGDYLKRVRVKTGAKDREWTEVLVGLAPDQSVVTHGAEALWLLELSEAGGMTNIK